VQEYRVALFREEFGGGLADAVGRAGDEDAGHGCCVLLLFCFLKRWCWEEDT